MAQVAHLARSRLAWARDQAASCRLCPRRCLADRASGQTGWCGEDASARMFLDYVHLGEDGGLAPSHAVFLTGCNLACPHCSTLEDRKCRPDKVLSARNLGGLIRKGRDQGARNLNLLGGEPFVHLPALIEILANLSEDPPPLVWNTNGYAEAGTLEMVFGLADIFLVDLKFGAGCAPTLSGARDYWETVTRNLVRIHQEVPDRLIVRHLVLPGHLDCCTLPVMEFIARKLAQARVSLSMNYLVMPQAKSLGPLARFLTREEQSKARIMAREAGLNLTALERSFPTESQGADSGVSPPENLEAELVIAPDGRVLLRHPTRAMTRLMAASFGDQSQAQGLPIISRTGTGSQEHP